jgi:hypothetical protein
MGTGRATTARIRCDGLSHGPGLFFADGVVGLSN